SVDRVLEVAGELTRDVQVLIIDDGSTDDSYDVAREVAAVFPQVEAIRQPQRRGLGPTLRNAQRRVSSYVVMVHDGVSSIDAEQLRSLWDRRIDPAQPADVTTSDLLRPKQNQAAMAAAHHRLMSFQLLANRAAATDNPDMPAPSLSTEPRSNAVGMIPPLPRPNFMGAVSDFALGE
ncbi:MAG: glycosyltransferase, partial [Planctomycetota bacterium]